MRALRQRTASECSWTLTITLSNSTKTTKVSVRPSTICTGPSLPQFPSRAIITKSDFVLKPRRKRWTLCSYFTDVGLLSWLWVLYYII